MAENKEIQEFKATIVRQRFANDRWRIYVVDVDKSKYPNIKRNKESKFIVCGDTHTLVPNIQYTVKATEDINSKYGYQYKIVDIRRDKPTNKTTTKNFLTEVITHKQADTLLSVYPNIVDKVMKNDLDDIDLNKTKGIKEFTFNKIKQSIVENFCLIDLVDKFGGVISFNTIKKLYDKYSSTEIILKKMKLEPYKCLCDLSRVGFTTADGILLNLEKKAKLDISLGKENVFHFNYDLEVSEERMIACVKYMLKDNESNGNTCIDIQKLRTQCKKLTPQCIKYFAKIIQENKEMHIDKKTKSLSTKLAYDTEKYIANILINMLNNSKPMKWDIQTELYRLFDDMEATDEQMNTLSNLCKYNVSLLTACGGAGKSASIKSVVNMLDDNNKTYLLCSPTGKASEVLSDYVGKEAGTIHRQLDFNPSNGDNPWGFNEDNKLNVDVVIVDEFGMTDIYLMKHLLEAIDSNKTKILLVFDSYQLSSVGCGNIAHDLLTSGIIPTTYLTKIFRYDEGGLMQVVTKIRNGENFLPSDFKGVKIFGTKKDYVYIETPQSQIIKKILKIYEKLLKDGESCDDIMILSCYNKGEYGTKTINEALQHFIQNEGNKYIQKGFTKFYVNDKVIQTSNNYKARNLFGEEIEHVYNGNSGIITKQMWDEVIVQFKNKQILYNKTDLENLALGYCISTHRSQGSSCKNVILITPEAHTHMLNSNLLYVGGTRAKKRVYHIGNIKAVNRAIKKKENLQRNTFLCDLLKQEYNKTA